MKIALFATWRVSGTNDLVPFRFIHLIDEQISHMEELPKSDTGFIIVYTTSGHEYVVNRDEIFSFLKYGIE